jgi:uncharacterized protein (DUF488 family)
MKIFTIGFTKSPARSFFSRLKNAGVRRVVDVRLNNVSQLAGFAKREDLQFFLNALVGADYVHRLDLAPTAELLDAYKKRGGDWDTYERGFLALIQGRHIEESVPRELLDHACLLCSEDKPDQCHRRLVAEYLRSQWGNVEIEHL